MIALEWLFGGLRFYIMLRPDSTLGAFECIKAFLSALFAGSVTPFQAAGLPTLVFLLHRRGVSSSRALAVAAVNTFFGHVYFFLVALLFLVFHPLGEAKLVMKGIKYAFVIVFVLFSAIFIFSFLPIRFPKAQDNPVFEWLYDLKVSLRQIFFTPSPKLPITFLLTAAFFVIKASIACVLLKMFGFDGHLFEVFLINTFIWFVIYLGITPGGGGVAEVLFSGLMTPFVPKPVLPAFTFIWRFFSAYIDYLTGAFLLLTF